MRKRNGETRAAVDALLADGVGMASIARTLGVSKSTVCFHMRRLGIPAAAEPCRRYDWDEIRRYYAAGHSATECRVKFGFGRNTWAEAIKDGRIKPRPRLAPLDVVLTEDRRCNRHHLKARLLAAGLKQEYCETCGLREWRGRPISLQLHHVNGDGLDNRIQNLLLLCPNCHSQTDSWGGRNKGRRSAATATPQAGPRAPPGADRAGSPPRSG
jgi:transposase-like protein